VGERPVLSINRGFSAPITLSIEQSEADRMFLARHDPDSFSRWEALNRLFTQTIIAEVSASRHAASPAPAAGLAELAGELAADGRLDAAFRALMLNLPGEADIAREIGADI